MAHLYPTITGYCACGCGTPLTGRKIRWSSQKCVNKLLTNFLIIKGDSTTIRRELYKRDKGVCKICLDNKGKWFADHILAVCNGGGGCTLDGYQTLCKKHHDKKTKEDLQLKILNSLQYRAEAGKL